MTEAAVLAAKPIAATERTTTITAMAAVAVQVVTAEKALTAVS